MNADSDSLAEIKRGLTLLHRDGDVIEMRVPKNQSDRYSRVTSGFFNDLNKLAAAIDYINTKYQTTVFITLNPIRATWQAVNNKCYVGAKMLRQELQTAGLPLEPRMKKSTDWETGEERYSMRTTDGDDILSRCWILIDVDAGQPAGTNSSEEEHEDALILSEAIRQFLIDHGMPAPAWTDSGNGFHLYLRVDLKNTPEDEFLVRRFLMSLAQRFDGTQNGAHVDTGMFDANRITKAAGTLVYKGEDTPERPRRRSHVVMEASTRFAMRELIEEVAEEYVLKGSETLGQHNPADAISDPEMNERLTWLKEFLDYYDIEYMTARMSDGYLILPVTCPNESEHTMDGGDLETISCIRPSGQYGFCCQHAHCQYFRGWKNFKKFMAEKTGKTFCPEVEFIFPEATATATAK